MSCQARSAVTRRAGWAFLAVLAGVPAPAFAADLLRVGTPEASSFSMAPIDVGIATGIFAKAGLDVQRIDLGGSAKLHPAMAAGALDVAMGSGSDFLFVVKGVPERGVAVWQALPDDLAIYVRPDSKITSLAGLRGARIGVSGPGGLTLWVAMAAVRQQGWPADAVQYAYLGGSDSLSAAVVSGQVDAAVSGTSAAMRLEALGRVRLLGLGGATVHPFIAHLAFATTQLMRERPDVLRRYLAGLREAVAFCMAHRDETLRITAAHTGLPPEIGARVWQATVAQFTTDGHFEPAAFAATKAALVELGQVAAADMPPDAALIDESFLPPR